MGCSTSLYHKGKVAYDHRDYEEAISLLEQAAEAEPDKAVIWQRLGLAYYKAEMYENAIDAFKQAALIDPDDGVSVLHLGLSHEILGNEAEAVQVYRTFLDSNPDSDMYSRIRRRVQFITDKMVREEVQAIIANESQIDASKIPSNTVGVLGFDASSLEPGYAVLGRGLSEMVTTDLTKIEELRLVERLRLNEIQKELSLSQSDIVDKTGAPRLGMLVGAATVVTGQLTQPEKKTFAAAANLISTEQGIATYPDEASGELEKFLEMEKQLVYNILDEMGYTPTPEEKARLDSIPTTSFLAFLAYSRGLTYADQGEYRLAEAEYEAALAEDPQFSEASEARQDVQGLSGYTGNVEPVGSLEPDILGLAGESVPSPETGSALHVTRDVLGFQVEQSTPEEGDNPRVPPHVEGKVTVTGTFSPDE